MTEYLPSVLLLGPLAVVALLLTVSRGGVARSAAALQPAVRGAMIGIAAQAVHFGEEWTTGFHERLPAVFGQAPMSPAPFVSFNVAWLGIWVLSVWGLARRLQVALFPLWFLAIASVANGIAHPLLALNDGGYFPGLATSPLVAVAGALLLTRLSRVTA
jgi:hypothetical protein